MGEGVGERGGEAVRERRGESDTASQLRGAWYL